MKNVKAAFLMLWITISAMAQEDTSFLKPVTLQEVVIQQNTNWRNNREKKQGADLQAATDQLLESIAGVSMIRRGSYAWEPTIRGLNAGQINMTISGMAIFGACTDRMDPASSYVEPNNLQSISVSYGVNNQSYGSTIGGGFNFKLKQPELGNEKKITGLAGLGFESNAGAVQTLAALEYSGDRFAIRGNGIFRKAGNYKSGGGEEVLFSQYSKWNGGFSAKYKLAEKHLLFADYIQDEGHDIGYPSLLMDVSYAKAKIASLSHLFSPDGKYLHSWETKAYFNIIDHAMDDTKRPKDQVPMHMDMPGTSQTMGFYSEAKWGLGSRNHITTRLNGYRNRLHGEMTMYPDGGAPMYMLTIPDAQRTVAGLDISYKTELSSSVELNSGVRTDYTSSSLYSAEGKQLLSGMHEGDLSSHRLLWNAYINGQYRMNDHWVLYVNAAKGMRSATLQELYGFYLFNRTDGYDYMGNPYLRNEKSWNLGAGARFQQKIFSVDGQVYSYFFNDYIVGAFLPGFSVMTNGAKGVKQYTNIPDAILYGAEAALSFRPLPYLKFTSTNTYSRGQDGQGQALPYISPFKSDNTVLVQWKGYRFSVSSQSAAAQNHVDYAAYGELPSKGYSIVNLGLGKDFAINGNILDVNVNLMNLFDTHYYEHLDILKLPRPGRNIEIHATYRF